MEKSKKIPENCDAPWKMQMSITLLITRAFVNFLAVREIKRLKFKDQEFESHSVYRVEEYIV